MRDHADQSAPARILELDGLRGLAVLMVVIFHYGNNPPYGSALSSKIFLRLIDLGWPGVDLFFVLSGCLITGILLESKDSVNYFYYFYMRRALRILPLYYAALIVFFWIYLPLERAAVGQGILAPPPGSWQQTSSWEQLWYWLHVSNWRSAFGYLTTSPITHFWSLAIEEQFYFIWPFVVRAASVKTLLKICGTGLLCGLVLRNLPVFNAIQTDHPTFLYRLTPFRLDSLFVGACVPLLAGLPAAKRIVKRWIWPASFIATVIFLVNRSVSAEAMAQTGCSALALVCFALVLTATDSAGRPNLYATMLRMAWLRRIGEVSYGIYVIHAMIAFPIESAWRQLIPDPRWFILRSLASILTGALVSYGLALVSWKILESPFLRLKRYFAVPSSAESKVSACAV